MRISIYCSLSILLACTFSLVACEKSSQVSNPEPPTTPTTSTTATTSGTAATTAGITSTSQAVTTPVVPVDAMELTNLRPNKVTIGEKFTAGFTQGVLPDGSEIAVAVKNLKSDKVKVYFNNEETQIEHIDWSKNVIYSKIPDRLLSTPGVFDVYVADPASGQQTNKMTLTIVPQSVEGQSELDHKTSETQSTVQGVEKQSEDNKTSESQPTNIQDGDKKSEDKASELQSANIQSKETSLDEMLSAKARTLVKQGKKKKSKRSNQE